MTITSNIPFFLNLGYNGVFSAHISLHPQKPEEGIENKVVKARYEQLGIEAPFSGRMASALKC